MLGPAFRLYYSYDLSFCKTHITQECFLRLVTFNLFLAGRRKTRKVYANRISMSRFSLLGTSFQRLYFLLPSFLPSQRVIIFHLGKRGSSSDENGCGTAAVNRCIRARIAVGEGRGELESMMEINLPSLTNPEAHKAAGGTDGTSC